MFSILWLAFGRVWLLRTVRLFLQGDNDYFGFAMPALFLAMAVSWLMTSRRARNGGPGGSTGASRN